MRIVEAIIKIYPDISWGFSYWNTQFNGTPWNDPSEGLVWENTEYEKPAWDLIMQKSVEVELQYGKDDKLNQILQARKAFQYAPIIIGSNAFKNTEIAQGKFFHCLSDIQDGDYPIEWRLDDDISWVSLSKEDARQLSLAIKAKEKSAYMQETALIELVSAAITLDEINSINVFFGNG